MLNEWSLDLEPVRSAVRNDGVDTRNFPFGQPNQPDADALVWHVLESPAPEGALLPDGFEVAVVEP